MRRGSGKRLMIARPHRESPGFSKDRWPARKTAGGALAAKSTPPTLTGMRYGRCACRMRRNAATHRQPCGPATGPTAHAA